MEISKSVVASVLKENDPYMVRVATYSKTSVFKNGKNCYCFYGSEEGIAKVKQLLEKHEEKVFFFKGATKRNGRSWGYLKELEERLKSEKNVAYYPLSGTHSSSKVPQYMYSVCEWNKTWASQEEQKSYALIDTTGGMHCVKCLVGNYDLKKPIPAGLIVWSKSYHVQTSDPSRYIQAVKECFEVEPEAIFETESHRYIGFYPF